MKEDYKNLTYSNLLDEHICCAFSDKKCAQGYSKKKQLLKGRIGEGYVFRKLDVRGKVFIEYGPADRGWVPVTGNEAMLINCFWVSGKYKGKGYGKELLAHCKEDSLSKGMKSIISISSKTKRPFMSDAKFLKKNGFRVVDNAPPYFELLQLDLVEGASIAQIKDVAKKAQCDVDKGLAVFYTDSCPFNDYYVNVELKNLADEYYIPLTIIPITSREQAQSHHVPHTLYSVFYNGEFLTHQILSRKLFQKWIIK